MSPDFRDEAVRQALAFGVGSALSLSRILVGQNFGSEAPFLTSWMGILAAAYIGGLVPALAVSTLGYFAGQYLAVSPVGPPISATMYIVVALTLALFGEANRRVLRRRREDSQRIAEMRIRLTRIARLNAMGEIAGTLAHELNQPLSAIGSYADGARWMLLERRDDAHEEVKATLDKIVQQVERAGEIIGRVRGQLVGEKINLTPGSLERMVRDAVDVSLAGAVKGAVTFRFDFDPSADQVLCDRVGVQQVIINLVRNAVEATADASNSEVRIASRRTQDGWVECSVSDQGSGLAPEIGARLFEPFASGKPGGMGIGLAVSKSIIDAHGGRIWAAPNPRGGTIFSFTLSSATPAP